MYQHSTSDMPAPACILSPPRACLRLVESKYYVMTANAAGFAQCEFCGQRFTRSQNHYTQKKRVCATATNHSCTRKPMVTLQRTFDAFTKGFSYKKALEKHLVSHSTNTPHKCLKCHGKAYRRKALQCHLSVSISESLGS